MQRSLESWLQRNTYSILKLCTLCTYSIPYLNYCTQKFGETPIRVPLERSAHHKKALRIIHNVGYLEHTNELFLQSQILKFMDLIKFKTVQMAFKAIIMYFHGTYKNCLRTKKWESMI